MTSQTYLNNYFNTIWRHRNRNFDQYEFTGWALVDKIKPNERVLDVGCGDNPFKGLIPNLVGIDPAFPEADVNCTIEEFESDQLFDVAFCLGSINFGAKETIERQIAKVLLLVKKGGRIYWRCNPGRQDHGNTECEAIDFYPWSIEEHVRLCDTFGCRLVECRWDNGKRLYAEWSTA
jgi:cyclopropane fatty-acyl-phospholipid synthase-like methyltransferase